MSLDGVDKLCLSIMAVGVAGNAVSGAVWSTLTRKLGGARFLLALSVSDLLFNVLWIVFFAVNQAGYIPCYLDLFYMCAHLAYTWSSYLTIAVVTTRYMSIAFPFSVTRRCSKVRQRVAISSLLVLAVVLHVPWGVLTAFFIWLCRHASAAMPPHFADFHGAVLKVLTAMDVACTAVILVINMLLLRSLWNMRKAVCSEFNVCHLDTAKRNASVLAVWMSSSNIVASVLSEWNTVNALHQLGANLSETYAPPTANILVFNLQMVSFALNSSVNFVLYFCLCDTFRSAVKQKLLRPVLQEQVAAPSPSQAVSVPSKDVHTTSNV